MPKVAHVTTVDLSLRYLLLNQLTAIQEAGHQVVGVSAAGPDVQVLEEAGIAHLAVPLTRRLTPLRDLWALWSLYRLMRRERFDVVHTHTPKAGLLGQLAAKLAGVPVVVNTLHGFYFHDQTPPNRRRFYVAMERIAARCSDVILSQNPEDLETALRERIATDGQIKVLGNGIDLGRFDSAQVAARDVAAVKGELGVPEGAPVVGFVGRLVEEKGILDLLEAAQEVLRELPETRFVLVGPHDSEKQDALNPDIAQRYGIADRCHFTGLRHDLPRLYAAMDILALPSHREGFPRTPMEAAAMGVPTVATDIRGCRQTVQDGETGLLVPTRDPERLAEALVRLLKDDALRAKMGVQAAALAKERFDERKVFERVLSEYDRLLGSR